MIDQIVVIERLFYHQEPKFIQLLQVIEIAEAVSAVGIHRQQDIGMPPSNFLDDVNVPPRFNLQLYSLISQIEMSPNALEQSVNLVLNAETDSDGDSRPRSADEGGDRRTFDQRHEVHESELYARFGHIVSFECGKLRCKIVESGQGRR